MSKLIQLFAVHETKDGVSCSHIKSAYNIAPLFRCLNVEPNMQDVSTQRCIEAIKTNGKMFVYITPEIKKFHYSREALMEEVEYYLAQQAAISAIIPN